MDVFLEHTLEGAGANDCAADSAADEFCQNSKSRRIRDASGRIRDASGIGINSAGVCIWPVDPLLAHAAPLGRKRPLSANHGGSLDGERDGPQAEARAPGP